LYFPLNMAGIDEACWALPFSMINNGHYMLLLSL
jgi:hypothetical protein